MVAALIAGRFIGNKDLVRRSSTGARGSLDVRASAVTGRRLRELSGLAKRLVSTVNCSRLCISATSFP